MRRALPLGFLAVAFLAPPRPALGSDATPAPAAPAALPVRVELKAGGPDLEGTLALAGVTVKTETGSQTIDAAHLRAVAFALEGEGAGQDTVQLTDRTTVRGRVRETTFAVRVGGERRTLTRAEVREVRFLRPDRASPAAIVLGLVTLAAMEVVLGIDNIVFLAIVAGRLPVEQRPRARKIGLAAALGTRLLLLLSLSFLLGLTAPVFTLPDLPFLHEQEAREVSWRDLILLVGGTFLIGKSVLEMHERVDPKAEGPAVPGAGAAKAAGPSFARAIATIALVDIVFSLDSVITAIGMVDYLWVMVAAMVLAMGVMLLFSEAVARFVDRYPTIKVLALSFLILIGAMLVAEGLGQHIDKGYIYFAMAFAVGVEALNLRSRRS